MNLEKALASSGSTSHSSYVPVPAPTAPSGSRPPASRHELRQEAVPTTAETQLRATHHGPIPRSWTFDLLDCCTDLLACLEGCCCGPCQISRQCNMVNNGLPSIHWPYCMLLSAIGLYEFLCCFSCIVQAELRRRVRLRYNISGSVGNDVCFSCCCSCCVTTQVLREMTAMGDFPGATCYEESVVLTPDMNLMK